MQFWVLFDLRPKSHRWWHPYAASRIWFFICQSFYPWNWDSLVKYYIFTPPKILLGEKSVFGEVRREERGRGWMGRKYEWQLADFHKMLKSSVGFIGFVQGPPCSVSEGSGRIQSGIWPLHITISKLKQIKKERQTIVSSSCYAESVKENVETGEKELCWYDITCARWQYLPWLNTGNVQVCGALLSLGIRYTCPPLKVSTQGLKLMLSGPAAPCAVIFLGCLQAHVWPCVNGKNRV